jgi:TPR repeat protein
MLPSMPTPGGRKWSIVAIGCVATLGLALAAFRLGSRVAPVEPTAASALNPGDQGACHLVGNYGQPLVVDWEAPERIDMEEAMHDGVAVVACNGASLRLLRGCSASGSYGFLAVSRSEELVRLESKDDLRANLGSVLSTKLDAELARDRSLDVAMIMVGKKRTTVERVNRRELRGGAACEGATHFVRGAFVGAFALGIGTKGSASSVSGVFSGSGESSKVSHFRDGDEQACDQLPGDAPAAADKCHALVRLEVMAIAEGDTLAPPVTAKNSTETSEEQKPVCSPGLVQSAGKCTVKTPATVYDCDPTDAADCADQCRRGNPSSCTTLGTLYASGQGVQLEPARAIPLYEKGCDGGNWAGCFDLGLAFQRGLGVPQNIGMAKTSFKRACDGGNARGCTNLGFIYETGKGAIQDFTQAMAFYRRGCDAGNPLGCTDVGLIYANGKGVATDLALSATFLKRGCEGGDPHGCSNLGTFYENGRGIEADLPRATALYEKACKGGDPFGCKALGFMFANGKGVPKDFDRARTLYERACNSGASEGCSNLGQLEEEGLGGVANRALAVRHYEQGCQAGQPWGCEQLRRLRAGGRGNP